MKSDERLLLSKWSAATPNPAAAAQAGNRLAGLALHGSLQYAWAGGGRVVRALAARPWVGGIVLGTTKPRLISAPKQAPAWRAGTSSGSSQHCVALTTRCEQFEPIKVLIAPPCVDGAAFEHLHQIIERNEHSPRSPSVHGGGSAIPHGTSTFNNVRSTAQLCSGTTLVPARDEDAGWGQAANAARKARAWCSLEAASELLAAQFCGQPVGRGLEPTSAA
jgi:hypothetical protein